MAFIDNKEICKKEPTDYTFIVHEVDLDMLSKLRSLRGFVMSIILFSVTIYQIPGAI